MVDVKIMGISICLPGPKIDNKTLSKVLKANEEWIDFFIGTKTRHFCVDIHTGEVLHSLSDLCAEAAKKAIAQSEIDPMTIDAIVLGTATPDHLMPATVNMVADKLGLNNIATYELQSGCAGAIQVLDLGTQLIKSGKVKNVLVIGGDVCNKFLNLRQDFTALSSNALINYVLFGDGAGAIVLTGQEDSSGIRISQIINRFTGLGQVPGQMINWFGGKDPDMKAGEKAIFEDYKAIEARVPVMAKELLDELLMKMNWKQEEVSYFLPPQLSKNMTEKIIDYLGVPFEKTFNCVEFTGNNGNALPFMQLDQLSAVMQKGEKGIILAIESSKWLKAGVAFYV